MKVVFLDIDGVLNTEAYRENPDVDYFEEPISELHMCLLEHLIKVTAAKIVLSSTWRIYWEPGEQQYDKAGEYFNKIFRKYGLDIFDKTPELKDRDAEITEWLNSYPGHVDSFVIIDDFDFTWSPCNESHLVKTNDETGLDEVAIETAIKILQ